LTSYIRRQSSGIGRLDGLGAERAARVVDQHVQHPAHGLGEAADRVGVGDVAGDGEAADLVGERLDPVGTPGGADDAESCGGQGAGGGGPDPAGGSGHDGGADVGHAPIVQVLPRGPTLSEVTWPGGRGRWQTDLSTTPHAASGGGR
jgi:hypothetical protein